MKPDLPPESLSSNWSLIDSACGWKFEQYCAWLYSSGCSILFCLWSCRNIQWFSIRKFQPPFVAKTQGVAKPSIVTLIKKVQIGTCYQTDTFTSPFQWSNIFSCQNHKYLNILFSFIIHLSFYSLCSFMHSFIHYYNGYCWLLSRCTWISFTLSRNFVASG